MKAKSKKKARGLRGCLPLNLNIILMIDFYSYNVRGLNSKCDFIKDFIKHNKLSLVGLLETRVQEDIAKIIFKEIAQC